MKKFCIIIALLLCSSLFVFAACEENKNKNDKPEQPSVSYEVTAEEWRSALDESVLDNISYIYTLTGDAQKGVAEIQNLKKDGSILRYEKQTMTAGGVSQTQEFYYEYTQNENYQYVLQDNGLWLKTNTSVFPSEQAYFFVQLKNVFSDFTFNSESKTYNAADVTVKIADTDTYHCSAQVKFENKKLISVRLEMETENEGNLVHLYEIKGTANITLPSGDQLVTSSSPISQADWENALNEKIFDNISYSMTRGSSSDETYSIEVQRQKTSDALYIRHVNVNSDNFVSYYEITADTSYYYSQSGDKWIKTLANGYYNDTVPELILPLKELYSQFTFNEENNNYTAVNLPFEIEQTPIVLDNVTVEFTNKNISYMRVETTMEGITYFFEIRLSAHGTTAVDIPTGDDVIDETHNNEFTEEEWLAAFDKNLYSNYTLNRFGIDTGDYGNRFDIIVRLETGENSLLVYCKDFDSANEPEGTETYSELLDKTMYEYKKENGEWVKRKAAHISPFGSEVLTDEILAFKNFYNSFKWDGYGIYFAEKLTYPTGSPLEGSSITNVTITFTDGFITSFEYDTAIDDKTVVHLVYELSDFGKSVVELPTNYIDKTQPDAYLSQEEWNSAFSDDIFDNISYTQTLTVVNPDTKEEMAISSQYDIVHEQDRWLIAQGNALLYEVTSDATYIYELQEGTWTKRIYENGFHYDFCYFMILKDMYETFQDCYDTQSGNYIAKGIQIDIGSPTTCDSVTLTFANKKLTFVRFDIAENGGSIECEVQYGYADVRLPDDYNDETQNNELTEKEWLAAFDAKNFENVTYISTNQSDGETIVNTITIYTDGTSTLGYTSASVNGTKNNEYYFEYTADGTVYRYMQEGDIWSKSIYDGDADPLQIIISELGLIKDSFSQLKFMGKEGIYRGENVSIPQMQAEGCTVEAAHKEGKIVSFSISIPMEGTQINMSGMLDYSTDKIVLPVV